MIEADKFALLNVLLLAIIFLIGSNIVISSSEGPASKSNANNTITLPTPTEIPTNYNKGLEIFHPPVFIDVPKMLVQANVESVGLDAEGKMANPEFDNHAAWFHQRAKAGEKGNVIISGHLDTALGAPSLFYNLNILQPGDEIFLLDASGKQWKYIVQTNQIYESEQFPIDEVFNDPTDEKKLHLITCEGYFDQLVQKYSHRVLVSAVLAE